MSQQKTRGAAIGTVMVFFTGLCVASYFVFAAVQGDYGHFRRVQIEADEAALKL